MARLTYFERHPMECIETYSERPLRANRQRPFSRAGFRLVSSWFEPRPSTSQELGVTCGSHSTLFDVLKGGLCFLAACASDMQTTVAYTYDATLRIAPLVEFPRPRQEVMYLALFEPGGTVCKAKANSTAWSIQVVWLGAVRVEGAADHGNATADSLSERSRT